MSKIFITCIYSGGQLKDPTYKEVCTDKTGHAEVVEVTFDANLVSYEDLLRVFWIIHDPTTLNRQGWDIGAQYRSVIFYHSINQKELALKSRMELERSGKFENPIVTAIEPAKEFYKAEEYHQQYNEKQG